MNKQQFKEQTVEVWQAKDGNEVVFQDPSRAIVNGYVLRHNLIQRPVATRKPYSEIYPELCVPKEGDNVRVIADDHNYGLLTSVLEVDADGKLWVAVGKHGTDEYYTHELMKIHETLIN